MNQSIYLSHSNLSAYVFICETLEKQLFTVNNGILVTPWSTSYRIIAEPDIATYTTILSDYEIRDAAKFKNNMTFVQTSPNYYEWIAIKGGCKSTAVEQVTDSPTRAKILARHMIITSHPYDLIWFLNYDEKNNFWSTTKVMSANILKKAVKISGWPAFQPSS